MWNPFTRVSKREASASSPASGVTVRANVVRANTGNALQVAAFYHAVELRSNTFARANILVERYNPLTGVWTSDIKNLTFAQNYRHLQYLLTVRPNSRMTASQMWRRLSQIRDMEGKSAIYMVRDGADVYQLIPCNNVSYNTVDDTFNLSSDEFNKTWVGVDQKDVILLKGTVSRGQMLGESLVRLCNRDLTLQLTANDFITKTYAKGGTFRAIVKQETQTTGLAGIDGIEDGEMEKKVQDIQEKWNNGDDLVYDPSAANLMQISQSFQDLQLDLQNTKAIENVARVCGVPLPLMFCSTNAVYKSIDDAWHTFLHLTMEPMWDEVAEELNAKYFGEDLWGTMRFRFDSSNICLDSENIKATTASARRSAGITTANEERAYMGLPAVEGGNELNKPAQPSSTEPKQQEGEE